MKVDMAVLQQSGELSDQTVAKCWAQRMGALCVSAKFVTVTFSA